MRPLELSTGSSSTLNLGDSVSYMIIMYITFYMPLLSPPTLEQSMTPYCFSRQVPMLRFGFHCPSSFGFSERTEIYLPLLSTEIELPPSTGPALHHPLTISLLLSISLSLHVSFSQWKSNPPTSIDKSKAFPECIVSMKLFQMTFN